MLCHTMHTTRSNNRSPHTLYWGCVSLSASLPIVRCTHGLFRKCVYQIRPLASFLASSLGTWVCEEHRKCHFRGSFFFFWPVIIIIQTHISALTLPINEKHSMCMCGSDSYNHRHANCICRHYCSTVPVMRVLTFWQWTRVLVLPCFCWL